MFKLEQIDLSESVKEISKQLPKSYHKIGSGMFSLVYRVNGLKYSYALKIYDDPAYMHYVETVAPRLRRSLHKQYIPLIYYQRSLGTIGITLTDLYEKSDRKKLKGFYPRQTDEAFKSAVTAVYERRGEYSMDIGPANIMFSNGCPILTDPLYCKDKLSEVKDRRAKPSPTQAPRKAESV